MRKVGKVLLIMLIVIVAVVGATIGFVAFRQLQMSAQVEREWQATHVPPVTNLGTTTSLEIIPLVDELASTSDLQIEHGVSYVVKTDDHTILFDVGQNTKSTDPSPLEANMQHLGISLDDVDIIVISHSHPDHTGGMNWWRTGTFSVGNQQVDLTGKALYVPTAMSYPGLTANITVAPQKLGEGVATLGTIPYAEVWQIALFQARNVEQALVVNVEGHGLVIITGCGHQTLPKLIARTQTLFNVPIVGIVGGLHYENRAAKDLQPEIERIRALQPELIALSPHDSEATARTAFRQAFPAIYQDVRVGIPIRLGAIVLNDTVANSPAQAFPVSSTAASFRDK